MAKITEKTTKTSPASIGARAMSRARWAKTTPDERSKFMSWVAKQPRSHPPTGRPRDPNRCPCGKFTLARAEQRRHKCVAPSAEVEK